MSSQNTTELFAGKKHTELYAQFRPTYPEELFTTIFSHVKENKKDLKVLDVGYVCDWFTK